MKVHILATCRKADLLPYTLLVFDTLRVGFPTSEVVVHINRSHEFMGEIEAAASKVSAEVKRADTNHHKWIESLLESGTEPFFLCDTDVIFYSNFEQFIFTGHPLAGFRIPEWQDEYAGAITRSRLHPSLLYLDPALVKERLSRFNPAHPDPVSVPFCNPVYPLLLPLNGRMYFHDTTGLLYHAIGGHDFTEEQKDAYFHLHFSSVADLVLPRLAGGDKMLQARAELLADPSKGKGAWREQMEYFEKRQPAFSNGEHIVGVTKEDSEMARVWNARLCNGDRDAMVFNDFWHHYCHGIDDLIDTMQDGRPRLSREEILGLFINAAFLYNCPFFVAHRQSLYPVVLLVTNAFADSVAWERSPVEHRRKMADVMRTCGDEMYYMVAMLKGGWQHMRNVSPAIRERDWLGHHDQKGYSV